MLYRFFPAAALFCGLAALLPLPQAAAEPLNICAVPQLYPALTAWAEAAPEADIALHFDSAAGHYARLINEGRGCDILLSSDERLPIQLIRAGRADAASLHPFATVPLTLYSQDAGLFKKGMSFQAAVRKLSSLALPRAKLTPVGFAAAEVTSDKKFPTARLNGRIYPADHEYQAYAMISSGNVQAGFITLPLALGEEGSWVEVPGELYPEICYYVVILNTGDQAQEQTQGQAKAFSAALNDDEALGQCLQQAGFTLLPPEARAEPAAAAEAAAESAETAGDGAHTDAAGEAAGADQEQGPPAVPAADPHEFDDLDDDLFDYLDE